MYMYMYVYVYVYTYTHVYASPPPLTLTLPPSLSSLHPSPLQRLWPRWDPNGDGSISYAEFQQGLLPYILQHYPGGGGGGAALDSSSSSSSGSGSGSGSGEACPDMSQHPRLWFAYWDDEDGGNGTLSKSEVLRAIVKTFRLREGGEGDAHRALNIASTLDAVWPLFDHDGSGEIDVDEFTTTDGLCDTLLATLVHERV